MVQLTRTLFIASLYCPSALSLSSLAGVKSGGELSTAKATIAVCTGPDCRADGVSGSLKAIQRSVSELRKFNPEAAIKVEARQCLGPCGDGPCVLVQDGLRNRVVREQPKETKVQGSLVPPSAFGSDPTGVYQVRTNQNVDFVVGLAAETAGCTLHGDSARQSTLGDDPKGLVTSCVRPWYDRPNNERKGLQRLGQFLVVVGLAHYFDAHDSIGTVQWTIAGVLFVASNFIMKESLADKVLKRFGKRTSGS